MNYIRSHCGHRITKAQTRVWSANSHFLMSTIAGITEEALPPCASRERTEVESTTLMVVKQEQNGIIAGGMEVLDDSWRMFPGHGLTRHLWRSMSAGDASRVYPPRLSFTVRLQGRRSTWRFAPRRRSSSYLMWIGGRYRFVKGHSPLSLRLTGTLLVLGQFGSATGPHQRVERSRSSELNCEAISHRSHARKATRCGPGRLYCCKALEL